MQLIKISDDHDQKRDSGSERTAAESWPRGQAATTVYNCTCWHRTKSTLTVCWRMHHNSLSLKGTVRHRTKRMLRSSPIRPKGDSSRRWSSWHGQAGAPSLCEDFVSRKSAGPSGTSAPFCLLPLSSLRKAGFRGRAGRSWHLQPSDSALV